MWTPDQPGIQEARLFSMQALLVRALPDLNTVLGRDAYSDLLVTTPYPILTTPAVVIGSPQQMWDPITDGGAVRIAVCGGGIRDGLDFQTEFEFLDSGPNHGKRIVVHTAIYAFLHPDPFRMLDLDVQTTALEITQARLSDFLRATLNSYQNIELALESKEFTDETGATTDRLTRCLARTGLKGFFQRGFDGDVVCHGVHIDHEGTLA